MHVRPLGPLPTTGRRALPALRSTVQSIQPQV
jgi:hypothetical protein